MLTKSDLTIIIPAKNEERLLPNLLKSLALQDYPAMSSTKLYIADAGSTDRAREVALSFSRRLNVEIIQGGLPAVGRNHGARLASTRYLLFIDADIEIGHSTFIRRTMETADRTHVDAAATS